MNQQSHDNSKRRRPLPRNKPQALKPQPSAALRGASLAFSHARAASNSGQAPASTTPGHGLRAAAAAAAESARHTNQPSNTEAGNTKLSVRDRIGTFEGTSSQTNLRPTRSISTSSSRRKSREEPPPSHLAAQIASQRIPAPENLKDDLAPESGAQSSKSISNSLSPNKQSVAHHSNPPMIITPRPVRTFSASRYLQQQQLAHENDPDTGYAEGSQSGQNSPGIALEAALGAFARTPSRTPSVSVRSERSRSSSTVSRPRTSLDKSLGESVERRPSASLLREVTASKRRSRISPSASQGDGSAKELPKPVYTKDWPSHASTHTPEIPVLRDQKTGLTESALADAMVASSLASSRAPSPHRQVTRPPPPPRHPSKSRGLLHRIVDPGDTRTPSPPKKGVLKQTLRKAPKSDDTEDADALRRGRRHLVRKHHRKHHEGDRKKWRDEVTMLQRKRYEGVWASNRGLFIDTDFYMGRVDNFGGRHTSDLVVNLVVRDIWKRSRLPDDVLEEIWDLVDQTGSGALGRDEFVVGMWLIDQRLRGRKLPPRVSYSVWSSVRHSLGLQVKNKIK